MYWESFCGARLGCPLSLRLLCTLHVTVLIHRLDIEWLTRTRSSELKLLAAAVYTNYTTSIIDDKGIEQEDGYLAGPVGNKLVLGFQRVVG